PVIFLTALDELEDKLAGFDVGADDYLVKPFQLAELAARVEALGRRAAPHSSGQSSRRSVPSEPLEYDDLLYDTGTLEVRRGTRSLELNRVGHQVLQELLRAAPNVVSRERLEEILWEGFSPGGSVLRTHIYAVRKAVDGEGEAPLVHTVRGMGYRLWREQA
ncbi:MAG: response regulator transcription factor, partial [Planctomycetota bacterium]